MDNTGKAEYIIRIEKITKYYEGKIKALDEVSIDIPAGIIGLLGQNGAGKTTLIKVLLGLVSFHSGSGSVLGFDIKTQTQSIRQKVGYQPEDDCIIVGLSGVEMVGYMAQICGFERKEGMRRAHEILDYLGFGDERYRNVATYSSGMKQIIKIAQALVHDPEILILDEPTSGLDPKAREKVLNIIYDLGKNIGKSVILSTHILSDVEKICNYVVIISKGKILASDKLNNLKKPIENSFFVKIHPFSDEVIELLRKEGYIVEKYGFDVINIISSSDDVANQLLKFAKKHNLQVRQFVPARSTMEEIFISAISKL